FSACNFKPGNAWRRTTIGPRHAARIEKQNAPALFVTRDVRVPVQKNVDIIRWMIRRNMLQAKFQPAAHNVEDQWPLTIAVAISAHNDDARTNRAQLVKNRFCANIAKMPDFTGILGHFLYAVRQAIVRVCNNKHAQRLFRLFLHACTRNLDAPRIKTKRVWRGWNAPNPLIGQRSNLVLPGLFKPRPFLVAAEGEEQIAISVEDLDRASSGEAVGGGKLYRFGSFTSAVKIAFRGIAVKHSSIRVILTAWLALPNTVFGPLTGIATRWDPIAGVSATLVEGHDSRK